MSDVVAHKVTPKSRGERAEEALNAILVVLDTLAQHTKLPRRAEWQVFEELSVARLAVDAIESLGHAARERRGEGGPCPS